ncbi:Inhibitor of apoptosis protein [Fasciola gigantica]|uniref:Inhibitor of apoptosis protein n=1 Tax=Fasciola gigantica TaxID=46835 RepID=A0A504WUY7_FASGI|nr:Inhibitor of apoptosis protein [Fasciola gigantica]
MSPNSTKMSCFQNLCNTLDSTFAAAAQTEDELNYAASTLIVAGLLQMHTRTPRYASHRARLNSFPSFSSSSEHSYPTPERSESSTLPSAAELASAGFFHTGSGDETVCSACGLGLRDWQATDQPEACHFAYSTAEISLRSSGSTADGSRVPVIPCLYLAVHRLLVSELPLARKHLVPAGPIHSVCGLPGVVTPPVYNLITDPFTDSEAIEYASLADRLDAIARIMKSPPSPQGWPVENARALGHSDDLIVLALWRLQAEAAGVGIACPPKSALYLDPQGTADLLRAVLRVQEGFDATLGEFPDLDSCGLEDASDEVSTTASDTELSAEDAETAALSRCRCRRLRSSAAHRVTNIEASSPLSVDSNGIVIKRVRLPRFAEFLSWWFNRWRTTSESENLGSL